MEGPTIHRPNTGLKQSNKGFKSGKHSSKGELKRKNRGKVDDVKVALKPQLKNPELSKQERRQKMKDEQKRKRAEVLEKKRRDKEIPPRIVALIPLGPSVSIPEIKHNFAAASYPAPEDVPTPIPSTFLVHNQKQRISLITGHPEKTTNLLDAAKVADVVVFIMSADGQLYDKVGDRAVSLIKSQGISSWMILIQGLGSLTAKKQVEAKDHISRFFQYHFPDDHKPYAADTVADCQKVVRKLASQRVKEVQWREQRAYMLVDRWSFDEEKPNTDDPDIATLRVSGYLRGGSLSANQLVHLTGYGDFQLTKIEGSEDPYASRQSHSMNENEEDNILDSADLENQESLEMVKEVKPDGEQTWPTTDEDQYLHSLLAEKGLKKVKVPKGMNAYQASWIIDDEGQGLERNDEHKDKDMEIVEEKKQAQSSSATSATSSAMNGHEDGDDESIAESEEEFDEVYVGKDPTKILEQQNALREYKARRKEADDEALWPDEVELPPHISAKMRFQKYRGLKSFRTSEWDPKENLPRDYAKIFQFQNFQRTKKKVLEDQAQSGITSGGWVTLHIKDVPRTLLDAHNKDHSLVLCSLLKNEAKYSVLHFAVSRGTHYASDTPIKSKDPAIFHFGFRRMEVIPIYSQINPSCDKQKYERFFPTGAHCMATIFGPITFPPASLLIFQKNSTTGEEEYVGCGSLHSVDPDRIILKKIVLTGYPYRIHQKTAIIHKMFFNADDIAWFKPCELWTKKGRTGVILDSVGTHGKMKCQFDAHIEQNDTICISLYKRVFPKFYGSFKTGTHTAGEFNDDDEEEDVQLPLDVFSSSTTQK